LELIAVVCNVVPWGSDVKVAFQVQHGDSEVLSCGGGILRAAMKSLLILVCALMVPLWGRV
jgi:hypothetical protein